MWLVARGAKGGTEMHERVGGSRVGPWLVMAAWAAGSFGCGSDDASTAPACAERAPAATLTCLAAVGEREAAC
ncbi:MAG: hypothetical protein RIT45_669, partial [Pseudomonadota bacterium]